MCRIHVAWTITNVLLERWKCLKVDFGIQNVIGIPYTWYSPKFHSVWSATSRFRVTSHFETSAQSFKTFLIWNVKTPRSNFCEDCRRKCLEKVWLKKNQNCGRKIFTPIRSHVNMFTKIKKVKIQKSKILKTRSLEIWWIATFPQNLVSTYFMVCEKSRFTDGWWQMPEPWYKLCGHC